MAVKGSKVDGHQFIETAIEKGATAIVCENLPAKKKKKEACRLQRKYHVCAG